FIPTTIEANFPLLKQKDPTAKEDCTANEDNGFESAAKDLDTLLQSQRSDKNKEGLGYSVVPPPAQVYSPTKKDISWTGLPEFLDDTITDYRRPSPAIESNSDDFQNRNPSVTETEASSSTILSKPTIKFVKSVERPIETKTDKVETAKKPAVKYAELYRKSSKSHNVRGNQRNWNNLKSYQLGKNFVMKNKACFNCGDFDHLSYDYGIWVEKGKSRRKNNTPHSYVKKSFQRRLAVGTKFQAPRVPTVNRKFPTVNRKFPTVNRKFPTGNSKVSTTDLGNKGKAVKALACWIWKPKQNSTDKECSVLGQNFKLKDDTNVLLRTPRQHNMYSIDLNNVVPHEDLTCLVAKASPDKSMLWHKRLGHLNFKTINRKQHKASCKSKLENSVSKPLHTLHMDLFSLTSDETSGILRNFITEIENMKDLKVKIIRCDNGDFLENKAIEKGAGPNWLFDIDSLINSMNYVPVVVAGTNSTNFSGIKDTTSQEVKKDVSSLRYITLPNWFHEELLESSSSNAQDACNADAPESSGNHNPTTTTTNPLADQMERLTVETPIPTVSSPIPTAILNDSIEPLRDKRLISKRVICQDETPSLDNITTLANRFDDILGVTTSTYDSHREEADNVWVLVDCPEGVRPIGTKWVLKHKKDERGIWIRNKAMLVAQGHTQEEGIDYEEVFAPVARIEAIRLFLAYASFMGFTVYQMDVKSAFLYGTIDEEVYVMQPPGFYDPKFPDKVYKMEKAMGTIDQTLLIRKHRGDFILVRVYVDDIIFGSSNPQLCREFEALMHDKFQMSAMCDLNFFLGLQVQQKDDGIFLSHDKYVGDILKKFGYSDVRYANTPMDKENPWGKDGPGKDVELHLYRSMIGSFMYLTTSRPDIMFAVCACARHQVTPKECHLHAVKRIFSDYGGAAQDRKSTTGGCQFFGKKINFMAMQEVDNCGHFNN
nr:hypothetical protein [Tanacetum cinerariifolium]